MTRKSVRLISCAWAIAALVIAIPLDSKGFKAASQIVIWTMFALWGPVAAGLITKGSGQAWFWAGLAADSIIHGMAVWHFRADLPFPSTLIAIVLGTVECIGLGVVSLKIREWVGYRSSPSSPSQK